MRSSSPRSADRLYRHHHHLLRPRHLDPKYRPVIEVTGQFLGGAHDAAGLVSQGEVGEAIHFLRGCTSAINLVTSPNFCFGWRHKNARSQSAIQQLSGCLTLDP